MPKLILSPSKKKLILKQTNSQKVKVKPTPFVPNPKKTA